MKQQFCRHWKTLSQESYLNEELWSIKQFRSISSTTLLLQELEDKSKWTNLRRQANEYSSYISFQKWLRLLITKTNSLHYYRREELPSLALLLESYFTQVKYYSIFKEQARRSNFILQEWDHDKSNISKYQSAFSSINTAQDSYLLTQFLVPI